jgi:hypothetical protein
VTRFVKEALTRAGFAPVLAAREAGDLDAARAALAAAPDVDLLALGALADLIRASEIGDEVRIHPVGDRGVGVSWIAPEGASELDVLRAVALARISGPRRARVGVDWGRHGLELAQVALGFGASDLRGAITRKSGLPILEGEALKVKGQGMVALGAIKKQEIAALVRHAGRVPVFVADERAASPSQEVAGA